MTKKPLRYDITGKPLKCEIKSLRDLFDPLNACIDQQVHRELWQKIRQLRPWDRVGLHNHFHQLWEEFP
jgi:hypothetical protein